MLVLTTYYFLSYFRLKPESCEPNQYNPKTSRDPPIIPNQKEEKSTTFYHYGVSTLHPQIIGVDMFDVDVVRWSSTSF